MNGIPLRTPHQILVVDDEPDLELLVRQRFRRQIRDKEFEFLFSHDGEEALAALAGQPAIELMLSDISMPVMDGLTLLGKLGDSGKTLRAVVVSAYGDMSNILTAVKRGAIDFLIKPIDFEDLEITIRKTLDHVAQWKESIQTQERLIALKQELGVAARIQQSILPRIFPPFPARKDFELHAAMVPAKEVGGDLFDFFLLDEHHLGFVVGDVSGKGVPAALFITMFYGILDTRTGDVEFAIGGHNPPYVFSPDGTARALPATDGGPMVGLMDDAKYQTNDVPHCRGRRDSGLHGWSDGGDRPAQGVLHRGTAGAVFGGALDGYRRTTGFESPSRGGGFHRRHAAGRRHHGSGAAVFGLSLRSKRHA
jgi:phosphoserine phosphatase RsbU/P